jgi:hypothetical protein
MDFVLSYLKCSLICLLCIMKSIFRCFCFFISIAVNAQDTAVSKAEWNYIAEPYLLFTNMSGDVGLGTLPDVTSDVDPNDIFSHLHLGLMLYFEASNEKWNFNSDLLYMNVSQGLKSSALVSTGEVRIKQLGGEVAGLYKLRPGLQLGLGLQYNSIKAEADFNQNNVIGNGTANRKGDMTKSWFDPLIVAVFTNKQTKKIFYNFRGEIGGFGLGADTNFAWQVQAYIGYHFSKLIQLQAGYRYISLNYENGTDSDRFLYDMDTYGPIIRFGFKF